jgi:hypothetical protein
VGRTDTRESRGYNSNFYPAFKPGFLLG